ncbi:MAG: hypothetical protein SX243_02205 [Acidobacteriota bacterium]|nr:hypothetical protein [Acidobacteriota bacterium]
MERFRKLSVNLVAALDEELQRRGYGSYARMERALGQSPKWWYYHRETSSLHLDEFFAILDHLGLDPGEFVLQQLRSDHNLDFGLDRPRGEPPALVTRAWERFRGEATGRRLDDAFFADLNEKGYRAPRSTLELLPPLVDLAAPADLPGLLEVAGAAHWALIELDAADHCFQTALEFAHVLGEHRKVGNLLRRYSYVINDHGDSARAHRLVRAAAAILLRENDDLGLAKACVEMGQWLGYEGRKAEAMQAFQTALRRLPETEGRYRFAALQSLGVDLKNLGQLEEALEYVERARAYLPHVSKRHKGKLVWLEAGIQEELGEFEAAGEQLMTVVEIFRTEHPGEAAIATCDLVRLQFLLGRGDDAYETALTSRGLVEPLAGNKVISAAIAELLRAERAGLTLALVARVQQAMEAARRDRAAWRRLAA